MEKCLKDIPMGAEDKIVCAVLGIEGSVASNGAGYCNVTVADCAKNKEVIKIWDTTPEILEAAGITVGQMYTMQVGAKMFNETPSYAMKGKSIKSVITAAPSECKLEDFIPSAPFTGESLYDLILKYVNKFCTSPVKEVVLHIYDVYKDALLYWSAAQKQHHAYRGGLLWHTEAMVEEAYGLTITRRFADVNKSLVIGACALHDIGKLVEMSSDEFGAVEYTMDGNLFGHLLIGYDIVKEAAKELGVLENSEIKHLLHIIVSHHGKEEWGAIKPPATREANLVHYIDLLDSRDEIFVEEMKNLEYGEMTKNKIVALEKQVVIKPTFVEHKEEEKPKEKEAESKEKEAETAKKTTRGRKKKQ